MATTAPSAPTERRILAALSPRVVVRTTLLVAAVLFALFLIYVLREPITWIAIAGFIAIALSGPVDRLHRLLHRRGPAIAVVYLLLIAVPAGLVAIIMPPVVREADELARDLPAYAQQVTDFVDDNPRLTRLASDYDLTGRLEQLAQTLPGRIGSAAGTLGNVGVSLLNSIFAVVTVLILSVFLVASGRGWLRSLLDLRPADQAERLDRTFGRIGKAIGAYVAGALAQATVAGITAFVVLSLLGVPFAGPLAVLVALFDLVPLVGATIGAVFVAIVTLFSDFPVDTLVWGAWSVAYQQIENTLIQPQIQKRAVDIHPFAVLVSVLFGSTLFGVLGALLAIPIAASIQIVIREFVRLRRYGGEVELPPGSTADQPRPRDVEDGDGGVPKVVRP